ncbi:hypothetical protein JCGZ_08271 [Jatropha curcas]|uniref:DUF4283 domain-containing protein n=1 Tax=Jatropha curcas TaxID=180498 RepID=A0A067KZ90_JATCU|nr:hypothetical protein JCGZ_08271 [Jatropha curcas]
MGKKGKANSPTSGKKKKKSKHRIVDGGASNAKPIEEGDKNETSGSQEVESSVGKSCTLGEKDTQEYPEYITNETEDEEEAHSGHYVFAKMPESGGDTDKAPMDKPTFARLFKDNRDLNQGFKLQKVDVGDEVVLDEGDLINVEKTWGWCAVGSFTGRFPGMRAVQSLVDSWGVPCKILPHHRGWIVFCFETEEERTSIFASGPYTLYGKSLFLRELPYGFTFKHDEFMMVPICVQLHDLPINCWGPEARSKIASRIGVPCVTDKITKSLEKIAFARVLVNVDVSQPPTTSFTVRLPKGVNYIQEVHFETYPNYCWFCKKYGHHCFN